MYVDFEPILAQKTAYTDPKTGIEFGTWAQGTGFTFGVALPSDALTTAADEYIGLLVSTGAAYVFECTLRHYFRDALGAGADFHMASPGR